MATDLLHAACRLERQPQSRISSALFLLRACLPPVLLLTVVAVVVIVVVVVHWCGIYLHRK